MAAMFGWFNDASTRASREDRARRSAPATRWVGARFGWFTDAGPCASREDRASRSVSVVTEAGSTSIATSRPRRLGAVPVQPVRRVAEGKNVGARGLRIGNRKVPKPLARPYLGEGDDAVRGADGDVGPVRGV